MFALFRFPCFDVKFRMSCPEWFCKVMIEYVGREECRAIYMYLSLCGHISCDGQVVMSVNVLNQQSVKSNRRTFVFLKELSRFVSLFVTS